MERLGRYFTGLRDRNVQVDNVTQEGFVLLMTQLYEPRH